MKLKMPPFKICLDFTWAVLAVLFSMVGRQFIFAGLGRGIPYLTFFPAVALASILGGLPGGIVATVLSYALVRFWILENTMSTMDWYAMSMFIGSNLLVSFMAGSMRSNRQRLKESMIAIEGSHVHLKETNAYLENLINCANAPIIVWDPEFKITRFNHAFESLTGRTESQVQGKTLEILFPSELTESSMDLIRRTMTGERWETVEIKILNLDGTVRTVLWNSATLFAPDGTTPVATIAQGQDITERKQAEESLRDSDAKNRALIRTIPDLIITYNRAGDYLDISSSNPSLLIMPTENILNQNIRDILPGPVAEQWLTFIGKALDIGAVQELEYALPISGAEAFFEARITPSTDNKVVAIVRDITDRKLAAEHQRLIEDQLQQAQKMESLGVLVAGVAHNLNNVLAIVMGTASLREQRATEPADRESYQSITKVCRRGKEVVKSLIHFAQPSLAVKVPFELNDLIKEVRVLLDNTTRNRITVIESLSGEPLWVNGDAGNINHALVNLCINSLDAMPDGGTLILRTRIVENDLVEVSVEDDGIGITPEVLSHVMEPFYTTKEVGKGTGLGLSMTYGVVKAHGGTIDISSQPEQGTTVKLRFPRIPAPVQSEPEPVDSPVLSLASMNVFLVDDDEDVRFLMTRMLKQAGVHKVKTFSRGSEVLEDLHSGNFPDVVILDQNMPGMNGTQTLELIRQLLPDLPILISSGQPDIEVSPDFKKPKVSVISKPFTLEEIQAKLAHFVKEPSMDT